MANDLVRAGSGDDLPERKLELLRLFLNSMAPATMRAYKKDLADFANHLAFDGDLSKLEAVMVTWRQDQANEIVLGYRNKLLEKKLAPSTINRRISAIRSMAKLGRTLGWLSWSIELKVLRTIPYRDTRGPGENAYQAVISKLERKTDAVSRRDLAIFRLLHDVALRLGEVAKLDFEHFDELHPEGPRLSVEGKGRRGIREWVSMPTAVASAIKRWLSSRGRWSGALFTRLDNWVEDKRTRLSEKAIWKMVRARGKSIGVVIRPHGLRHSAITTVLDVTGGDIRRAAKFARHSKTDVTMRYDDRRDDVHRELGERISGPNEDRKKKPNEDQEDKPSGDVGPTK